MRSATVVLFSSTAEANTSDHVDFRLRLTEIKSLQIEWISSRATKTFRAKEYRGPRGADVYPKMFSESRAITAWTTHSRWRKYIRAVDTRLGERHAAIMQWFSSCDNAYTVHVREWRVVQVHSVSTLSCYRTWQCQSYWKLRDIEMWRITSRAALRVSFVILRDIIRVEILSCLRIIWAFTLSLQLSLYTTRLFR